MPVSPSDTRGERGGAPDSSNLGRFLIPLTPRPAALPSRRALFLEAAIQTPQISTTHHLPFSPRLPVVVCWDRSGRVEWATVEPPHIELAQALSEATGELSAWLHCGGRLQEQAELWGVMPPESLHAQFLVWLADVERSDGADVAVKYQILDAAAE